MRSTAWLGYPDILRVISLGSGLGLGGVLLGKTQLSKQLFGKDPAARQGTNRHPWRAVWRGARLGAPLSSQGWLAKGKG